MAGYGFVATVPLPMNPERKELLSFLLFKNTDAFMYIGTDCFTVADKLEGIYSMQTILDFLNVPY